MKRGLIIIIVLMLIGIALMISKTTVGWYESLGNSDFFTFWLSGRLIKDGLDPYSSTAWLQGHDTYGSNWKVNQAFVYPLPLAVILAPLGILDLKPAYMVWVFFSVISLYLCVVLLLKYFSNAKKHFILPIIAGLILFRPLTSLLINGQISGFLLLVILLALLMFEKKLWFWGGVLFTLTLLKPQLGGILILLAGWYFLRHKLYMALAGFSACGIALFLLGFAMNHNWVMEFLSIISTKYNQTFGFNPTIWGLVFFITSFKFTPAIVIGVTATIGIVILFFVLVWRKKSMTPTEAVGMAIPIMLLATPYIWPYDQILLVLPTVQVMIFLKNLGVKYFVTSLVFIGVSIVSYILYGITINIQMENLNGLLTLIVLGGFITMFLLSHETKPKIIEVAFDSK